MPNRIVRDGILSSEAVCSLTWAAEVFYRRLQSVADDYGRYSADAILLRSGCYPRQIDKVSDSDIGKWLTQVVEAGLVRVYPASDGKRYLEIAKFGQQQRSKSKYPAPGDGNEDQLKSLDGNCSQLKSNAHLGVVVCEGVSVCVDDKEHAPSPQRGSRLPDAFPTPDLIQWARGERQDVDPSAESEKFRDYWTAKPGKDGRKSDWPATWRNWIRNARASARDGPQKLGKVATAIVELERMKHEHTNADFGTPAKAALLGTGTHSGD